MITAEVARFAATYSHAKAGLGDALGLSDDLLHVHAGLALFVVAALLTRRRMRSWWPLGVVVVFAAANEIVDSFGPDRADGFSALDLANTLVWPAVLFLLARRGKAGSARV